MNIFYKVVLLSFIHNNMYYLISICFENNLIFNFTILQIRYVMLDLTISKINHCIKK